jgi:hypothetical protein
MCRAINLFGSVEMLEANCLLAIYVSSLVIMCCRKTSVAMLMIDHLSFFKVNSLSLHSSLLPLNNTFLGLVEFFWISKPNMACMLLRLVRVLLIHDDETTNLFGMGNCGPACKILEKSLVSSSSVGRAEVGRVPGAKPR